jgi:predicted nucleic acid-binding protein
MILLDSDIMIDLLRRYPAALTWFDSLADDEELVLPGFVVMELIQGCRNKTEQEKLEKGLTAYEVIWPSPEICDTALTVFAQRHLQHNFGILDALIGQMAVGLDLALHTFNQKHYTAIPDLKTVQPYTRVP